jgi:hypothetical protein
LKSVTVFDGHYVAGAQITVNESRGVHPANKNAEFAQ